MFKVKKFCLSLIVCLLVVFTSYACALSMAEREKAVDRGEIKTVTFKLTKQDLSFYDTKSRSWVAEPGAFNILVGSSSRDIRLKGDLIL